ncbi:hypothetical protein BN2476_470065 [Paraburkholderia piptadeniae]|uniref:Uncharacterized protein n=1 Tax=Paraburkholderia piptadeniae TaxID=1701573 RepID=A0A1N7SF60_9BURK|nr:hypothetical protein BN2476_470065 [Paraburkholderia piptadeniae]
MSGCLVTDASRVTGHRSLDRQTFNFDTNGHGLRNIAMSGYHTSIVAKDRPCQTSCPQRKDDQGSGKSQSARSTRLRVDGKASLTVRRFRECLQ